MADKNMIPDILWIPSKKYLYTATWNIRLWSVFHS